MSSVRRTANPLITRRAAANPDNAAAIQRATPSPGPPASARAQAPLFEPLPHPKFLAGV